MTKSLKKAAVTGHEWWQRSQERAAKLEAERAKADARAAQPCLPGLEPTAPAGGLHGADRGGRR